MKAGSTMELKRICESLSYAWSLEPYFVVPVNKKFLYIRLLSQGGMVLKVFRDFQNGELSNFQEGLIGISDNCSGGSDNIEYKGPFHNEKEMEISKPDCFVGLLNCPFYRMQCLGPLST